MEGGGAPSPELLYNEIVAGSKIHRQLSRPVAPPPPIDLTLSFVNPAFR